MERSLLAGGIRFLVSILAYHAAVGQPGASPSAATERALVDRYGVTCHNDKLKTANLSLQGLDPRDGAWRRNGTPKSAGG